LKETAGEDKKVGRYRAQAMLRFLDCNGITVVSNLCELDMVIDEALVKDIIDTRDEIAHQMAIRKHKISAMLYGRLLPIVKQLVDSPSIVFPANNLQPIE